MGLSYTAVTPRASLQNDANNDFCSTKHSFNQGKESGLTYGLNTVRLLGGSGVRGLSP